MIALRKEMTIAISLLVVVLAIASETAQAGQGCPFDDGSCQEYCNQQGCNMGYCGHFAWIQCICRKCGDEWSWYDKVRYNPDKAVNQTELDSLKLNNTNPLILISNRVPTSEEIQQQESSSSSSLKKLLLPTITATKISSDLEQKQDSEKGAQPKQPEQQKTATLTTLLIPDLSDNGKLDLNDIPDENSDKFLDYLAKNHEKLVQATSAESQARQQQQQNNKNEEVSTSTGSDEQDQLEQDLQNSSTSSTTTTTVSSIEDDETIEIQISSSNNNSNNNNNNQRRQNEQSGTTTTTILSSEPAVN